MPAGAAVWGFASAAAQSEARRVDARLQSDLRVALDAYQARVDAAQAAARHLAGARSFQVALERRDAAAVRSLLPPGLAVRAGSFRVGRVRSPAVDREADVITTKGLAGIVVASVPLDGALASELRRSAAIPTNDRLVLLSGDRILAASPPLVGTVPLAAGRVAVLRIGGTRYRTLVGPPLPRVSLAVLTPQSTVDAANASQRDELIAGLVLVVLLVAIVAFLEGRSIVRTLRSLADAARAIAQGRLGQRVPVRGSDELATLGAAFNDMADQLQARLAELDAERGRLRIAIGRFGEALATNDVEQLLQVVVETAVEATGAMGATIKSNGHAAAAGNYNASGERLEHPLTVGGEQLGTLVLVGVFDAEERMTAASLAAHAAVALENARLHAIVERQALVDGLTGIANRRGCEDALIHEIARSDRLGVPFTLVVADLDDFKQINDRHGHDAGDDVLRETASVLRHTLRESDLPGRWGGEEFVLLLPGTEAEGGAQLAERVRGALRERSFHGRDGAVFGVTCSFGVAQHRPGEGERQLFSQADRALYAAKRLGKDRVELSARIRSL
ncbi:MAG: diguanylate cyclase [Acidobacteriota bacterium]|nr:diguanylate cyclase [Acidobacteriota bacterium]